MPTVQYVKPVAYLAQASDNNLGCGSEDFRIPITIAELNMIDVGTGGMLLTQHNLVETCSLCVQPSHRKWWLRCIICLGRITRVASVSGNGDV